MAMTREQMDRRMDEHFNFEARDDVAGVLETLAADVEHEQLAGEQVWVDLASIQTQVP